MIIKLLFLLSLNLVLCQDFGAKVTIPNMAAKFGEKYDEALEAIFSIAVRLEALLTETNTKMSKNFIVSPLGMAVGVGQLLLGARGNFQKELYELLTISQNKSSSVRHFDETNLKYASLHQQLGDLMINLNQDQANFKLATSSVFFVQKNLSIHTSYLQNVQKYYGTEFNELDFINYPEQSVKIINNWAKNKTNGLINEIITNGLSPLTVAIMANAIYFKSDWEIPFSSQVNRIKPFKINENLSKNVTMMIGEFENYKYVDSKRLNCKMVAIPYENRDCLMYIILPDKNNSLKYDINKFVKSLTPKDIIELIDNLSNRTVTMTLPKMTLSNTVKVLGPLRKYHAFKNCPQCQNKQQNGDPDPLEVLTNRVKYFSNLTHVSEFSPSLSLDLSGISTAPEFRLGELFQQTTLTINEKGTEAASITGGIIDYMFPDVSFKVDRPFLFFIRHEPTLANLFWGTIQDPTEGNDV